MQRLNAPRRSGTASQAGLELVAEVCAAKRRVVVAEKLPAFRHGLKCLINGEEDMECCGQPETAHALRAVVAAMDPELLVLDLDLGGGDGLELIKSLRAQFPVLRILILSGGDESVFAERVLRAGAVGYVSKSQSTEEILGAIRTVLNGEYYVSRAVACLLAQHFSGRGRDKESGALSRLSDRELQVFGLIGTGMPTRDIARRLGVSVKTIESHRENVKHKLGLTSGADLVARAGKWARNDEVVQSRVRAGAR